MIEQLYVTIFQFLLGKLWVLGLVYLELVVTSIPHCALMGWGLKWSS